MFYMDVWNDQIALRWDGSTPEGSSEEDLADYLKDEFVVEETKVINGLITVVKHAIPATGIPLRDRLKDVNDLWHLRPRLRGHAKWNEKQRCFFIALSKQNLQRIHAELGQIRVATGQRLIEGLKRAYVDFLEDVRKAGVCKSRAELPPYEYKAAPIGPYQHRGVVLLTNVHPGIMFADCGMGKTYMVLCSTEQQILKGVLQRGKTIVCVKLATIRHGWLKDAARFTSLKVVAVWAPAGKKRKEKLLAQLNEPADLYVINHDGLRILEEPLAAREFKKVVVDESTILKAFRGMRATKTGAFGRSLMRVAAHADYRVIMSGTPAPNDADDLWGQFKFVDPRGFILEASWRDFQTRWMKEIHFGDKANPDTPSKWVMTQEGKREIADLIEPLVFRLRLRDHVKDLPKKTVMSRSLPMVGEQLKHYEAMEEYLETLIDDTAVTVTIQLSLIQKLRQITGGFLIDAQETAHAIEKNPKLEMLDELIEEEIAPDEKIVIFAQYQWEVETIESRYKHHGAVTVYGGNSGAKNLSSIDKFLEDPAVRIIVLHPRSAAHGVTLTNARYMIFYSSSYSNEEDYQGVKRIERASQEREMFVYYLLAQDSIDETMYECVQAKALNQGQLIDPDQFDRDVTVVWKSLSASLREKRKNRRRRSKKHAGPGEVAAI